MTDCKCKHEIDQCDKCGTMKCKKCGAEFVEKDSLPQYKPIWIYPYWQQWYYPQKPYVVSESVSAGTGNIVSYSTVTNATGRVDWVVS